MYLFLTTNCFTIVFQKWKNSALLNYILQFTGSFELLQFIWKKKSIPNDFDSMHIEQAIPAVLQLPENCTFLFLPNFRVMYT